MPRAALGIPFRRVFGSSLARAVLYCAGVLCLLAAVFIMVSSSRTASTTVQEVAVAVRDLPAGLVPQDGDIRFVRMEVDGSLPTAWLMRSAVAARPLTSSVARDSVLLESNFTSGSPAAQRHVMVAVPVERGHVPVNLRRGDVVDLWFTPRDTAMITGGADVLVSRRVVDGVTVCAVHPDDVSRDVIIEVCTPAGGVGAIIQATRAGSVDVVRARSGDGDA